MADALVKIVVGKLGAGKSAYCVKKALEALAAGDVLVTNLKLDWEAVRLYLAPTEVSRDNYRFVPSEEIDKNPSVLLEYLTDGGCTLIVDEVHLFLNSRKWKENMGKAEEFLSFLTQARKLDVSCYLITQDERNADAQLVRMATHIVRLLNWQHLPLLGKLLPLPLTVARICQPDGVTAVGRERIWRHMKLLRCYNSKQRFREIKLTGKAGKPVKCKRSKEMPYGAYLVAAGMVCLAIDYGYRWKADKRAAEKIAKDEEAAARRREREAVKPHKVMDPAAPPGSAVMGPPAVVAAPSRPEDQPVSRIERASIELTLPGFYKVNPAAITLHGGEVITHGKFFLAGLVRGWRDEGGTVLVMLDSKEVPQIRLFNANKPAPWLYDFRGGIVRRPDRGGSGLRASVVPNAAGVAQSGLGSAGLTTPDAAAAPVAGPAFTYSPPEPFIPKESKYVSETPRAMLGDGYRWPKAEVVPEIVETANR